MMGLYATYLGCMWLQISCISMVNTAIFQSYSLFLKKANLGYTSTMYNAL